MVTFKIADDTRDDRSIRGNHHHLGFPSGHEHHRDMVLAAPASKKPADKVAFAVAYSSGSTAMQAISTTWPFAPNPDTPIKSRVGGLRSLASSGQCSRKKSSRTSKR